MHAILIRNLKGRSPATDLFGVAGRRWLAAQELPTDEREMVEACLRGIDFLDAEVAAIDRALAELVLGSAELRRLLTLPGVNVVTACALLAAIGDVRRFPTARQLVSYLGPRPAGASVGLGASPARPDLQAGPGRDAACSSRRPGTLPAPPDRCFHERIAVRRGRNIATVGVARKLAVIAWHMLSRGEDYAFARPSLMREEIRKLELATGAERRKGKRNPVRVFATREQHRLDKQLAAQAEVAYRQLVQDWQPALKGTGAAPGRASRRPSSGQAARQETSPPPAL